MRNAIAMAVLLLAQLPSVAIAKRSELKSLRLCRAGIAKNSRLIAKLAFSALDGCHRRSNRGKATGDCNTFSDQTEATEADRGVIRSVQGINSSFVCPPGNPVFVNYPPSSPLGSMVLAPAIMGTIGASGAELQGAPDGAPVPSAKRARACKTAIGRARTRIARHVLREATACQKAVDSRSTTFGPIDPSCQSKAGGAFAAEMRAVRRRCRGLGGASVGSCADLPVCVRDSAIATGHALARITYGGPAICGNGVVDLGETCDDGNTDDTDACTSECQPATCGDGFVQAGVEACDDGNEFNDDGCTNNCAPPVCGDGIVNGSEQCDDGNTDPNDGCVDCQNSVTCTGGSIQADIQLKEPARPNGDAQNLAGVRFELTYPTGLDIPGSGFETDDTRLTILQGGAAGGGTQLLVDRDENGDGVDDTARVVYVLTGGAVFAADPLARVTFDCTAGTPVGLTSFGCTVLEADDALGTNVTIPTPGMPIPRAITCEVVAVQ